MLEDPYEFRPQPQSRFWKWTLGFWLAALFLLAGLLSYCAKASAASYIAKAQSGDTITVYDDEPCDIKHPWFAEWKRAVYYYQGQTYESCWRGQNEEVLVISSDGLIQVVPARVFRKNEAI